MPCRFYLGKHPVTVLRRGGGSLWGSTPDARREACWAAPPQRGNRSHEFRGTTSEEAVPQAFASPVQNRALVRYSPKR